MKVTKQSRRWLRLQSVLFVLLLFVIMGMLAWLSTRYDYQADWTANSRHTLSDASVALLNELKEPVSITVYASETPLLRKHISEIIERYRRYKPDVTLTFIDPNLEPQRVRESGITVDGEMVVEYQGSSENLQDISEKGMTNLLQRLARSGDRWLVFLEGHGERNPQGQAQYDLGVWVQQLKTKGMNSKGLNLASAGQISDNTTVLVIAGLQTGLLPGEVNQIKEYLNQGGNLLWLAEPGDSYGMASVAEQLGIELQAGIIVDPNVSRIGDIMFGTNDPRVALVSGYGNQAIVRGFTFNTLFPISRGIALQAESDWQQQALLQTLSNTWAETGEALGEISFDPDSDISGPLNIGVVLTRQLSDADQADDDKDGKQQRVVVIGDGDFLSNGFLGMGGNQQLGMNIINWLANDDQFIAIPVKTATDISLELDNTAIAIIGFGFLLVLPIGLLGVGLLIWLKRRRR